MYVMPNFPKCLHDKSLFTRSFPKPWILKRVRQNLLGFCKTFEKLLFQHFTSEFEIQIRGGKITPEGDRVLDQLSQHFEGLQFAKNVHEIVGKARKYAAPHSRVYELLCILEDEMLSSFPKIVKRIQNNAFKAHRLKDNQLCKKKCALKSLMHNFTNKPIGKDLSELLACGLKNVPLLKNSSVELQLELEAEAKLVCRNIFFETYGQYPRISPNQSFSKAVLEIMSQCSSNSEIVSCLVKFRDQFLENIPFFLRMLPKQGIQVKKIVNLIPSGCIISPSDKNLGISILPPEWFAKEYETQVMKGGHESIDMTESECLSMLQRKIRNFKSECSDAQLKILNRFLPRKSIENPRIGVLKLIPKVHKLVDPITVDSWMTLKSRPIRGAEKDPIKDPSKALYGLLQKMLNGFKANFPSLNNDQIEHFPVLKGCDDFLNRLGLLNLKTENFLKTIFLTSDFSDAYTETDIESLNNSISDIGKRIGYSEEHQDLMKKLVDLVFSNCYFYTPHGLHRQTKGMPMGDVSSRDALDLELVHSEFDIIRKVYKSTLNVHLYCRLVDDISVLMQGPFTDVRALLGIMASGYPSHMPLNCQLSFGYMRFLDLHVRNNFDNENHLYKLSHTLAYKEHSNFSFTPSSSNIHQRYKHAIVPIGLHRIHTRCSLPDDVNHHLRFFSLFNFAMSNAGSSYCSIESQAVFHQKTWFC